MILTQTKALFVDAYRELNARKLFWITMGLNLLVVLIFAGLGIDEEGTSFFIWSFDSPIVNSSLISPELFYKSQFVQWGIPVWLTWVASILALVSTAGMFPDLISGGVIETMLSRPISRTRLFLTKYMVGLLFVALQVLVFTTGCFLIILIRGGSFAPELFLAVPIVVLFFSYLFSFCAFIGLVTRSTIAALLLTMLFWCLIFMTNLGDGLLVMEREGRIVRAEDARENLENQRVFAERRLEQLVSNGTPPRTPDGEEITEPEIRLQAANPSLLRSIERVEKAEQSAENWSSWAGRVFLIKTVLPKTSETTALLDRYLITEDDINDLVREAAGIDDDVDIQAEPQGPAMEDPRAQRRAEDAFKSRSLVWVVGTSLVFEAVMLGLCLLIFRRRDF